MTDLQPLSVVIAGCSGRMGRMLLRAVAENDRTRLFAATEREGSERIGRSAANLAPGLNIDSVIVTDKAADVIASADAVIDFTTPNATVRHAELAAQSGAIHIIGTTGFTAQHDYALQKAARRSAQIRAGNMSLGVNLLAVLTEKIAKALDADFDIEIVEAHHNQKVDAPSGTALMFGEAAAAGRGVDLAACADRGRDGMTGLRTAGAIGFSAIRGGDIVGEHDVIFAGPGERIVLRHIATDRAIFARGAVKAALWGRGRPPGAYSMTDVLGLRD